MRSGILLFVVFLCCGFASQGQYKYKIRKAYEEVAVGPIQDSSNAVFNVSIDLDHYYPYCGGAYPDESEMNNYQILANSSFHLYNLATGEKQIVKTNENGTLELNLSPGNYGLREIHKDCTYDEFRSRYPDPGGDYIQVDSDCYKNWWKSNFLEFTVTSPLTLLKLTYTFSDHCFTGNNPCISYFGPYPP